MFWDNVLLYADVKVMFFSVNNAQFFYFFLFFIKMMLLSACVGIYVKNNLDSYTSIFKGILTKCLTHNTADSCLFDGDWKDIFVYDN